MGFLFKPFIYCWVLPITLLGATVSIVSRLSGGGGHFHSGVWESWGGWPGRQLKSGLPLAGPVAAITLGHIVIGVSEQAVHDTRAHERAHVRQCEWWGPLFLLAYPLASAWAWIRGGDPYRDNPFERAARRAEAIGFTRPPGG